MDRATADLSTRELYRLLTGCVLPRPVAWVSTLDAAGCANLAPFSFFTVASVNPPVLCFAPLQSDDRAEKDTLANIRTTGEFVVNIVSVALAGRMNQSSAPYPPGVSEFDAVGVTRVPSSAVAAPGVQEAPARFECTLRQIVPFGTTAQAGALVLGDVRHIHLRPDIMKDGRVDIRTLDAVGRLAGNGYATTRDGFELPRPLLNPE